MWFGKALADDDLQQCSCHEDGRHPRGLCG